jgi:hypothetical protein
MNALAKRKLVMYNITRAWRPTDRRPEADARGRTPGRAPVTCARGACEARGYRALGGTAEVRGRVDLVNVNPSWLVGAPRTAAHGRGARELRSGLRGVRPQAQTSQGASEVNSVHLRTAKRTKDEENQSAFTTCLQNRINPTPTGINWGGRVRFSRHGPPRFRTCQ